MFVGPQMQVPIEAILHVTAAPLLHHLLSLPGPAALHQCLLQGWSSVLPCCTAVPAQESHVGVFLKPDQLVTWLQALFPQGEVCKSYLPKVSE